MSKSAYEILQERGFIQQTTDDAAIRHSLENGSVTVYTGYDPTADSLHVGHLYTLMALRILEDGGHRPIALLGGGTALVGDPSGKSEMRQMLERDQIQTNLAALEAQVGTILDVAGGRTVVVNNADWLQQLSYIDFLRDVGRHFSVNRMLTAESYKLRLEKGLSFLEFNYQLLQAYDFVQLNKRYSCTLQLGGDDQWGNIIAGVDLCRRMNRNKVEGLTVPLQLTSDGNKMGKTAKGAVWLDPKKLSPYDYYQYFVNVSDDDIRKFLLSYTLLPTSEVDSACQLRDAALNQVKSVLGYEATAWVHGKEAAVHAHTAAQQAFGGKGIPGELLPSSGVPRQAVAVKSQIPSTDIAPSEANEGMLLVDVLVRTGLVDSKKAARRLIEQGGAKVGEEKINDVNYTVRPDMFENGTLMLRAGKKKVHVLQLTDANQS